MVYALLLTAVVAYLLGNHNGAVSVSAWIAHDDVRSHGSGNAGLTNFLRSYGSKSAILVVLVDVVKTAAACLVGGALLRPFDYGMEGMMLGAVMVSLGHDFPALMGFKGGKGILCGATAVFLLDWRIGAVLAVVFVASVAVTRYISVGSLLCAAGFGVGFAVLYWDRPWLVAGGAFIGALAIWMHRSNIVRLLNGNENKFTIRKKEKTE